MTPSKSSKRCRPFQFNQCYCRNTFAEFCVALLYDYILFHTQNSAVFVEDYEISDDLLLLLRRFEAN